MSFIARRGGKEFPLAFFAIRTPLLGFADHEGREAVVADPDSLGLLVRERSEVKGDSGTRIISRLQEMGRGDDVPHKCTGLLLLGPGSGVCLGFKVCYG